MGKPRRPPATPGTSENIGDPQTCTMRQFLTPLTDAMQAPMRDKMAATPASSAPSSPTRSNGSWDFPPELHQLLSSLPTKADLAASTSGLQESLLAEIRGLRKELGSLQHRVQHVETTQAQQSETLTIHTSSLQSQNQILQTMARHLEDLENRGRRNNIRVRGLPELEQSPSDLKNTLLRLFNGLIQRNLDAEIEFERLHRALRPKGPPGTPPRDVVCCLLRHTVKEEIMEAARQSRTIIFDDVSISLFQDLSPATLQSRRLLRPLTAALQERRIAYKWLFPFGMQVRTDDGLLTLRSELDLPAFMEALALPKDVLPTWPDLTQMYTPSFGAPSRTQRPRRRRYSSTRTMMPSDTQN
uniref:Uncharacterized protein n=1 Tax=Leptobrachium leishanense TaxID=445787 RepID=A0A8C5M7N6_9ANUR